MATAGHVDHGKTALLNALTGQETDRLDEEQERELTIDLGFSHLRHDELQIGFIDVPGHQNFIKNMVSGVGSVQGILFVVSAVDGWEAQSREHFEIVKLIEPDYCCFAMTKIDQADEEMQLLVEAEIEEAIESTAYEDSTIVPVSSVDGTGIDELKDLLLEDLSAIDNPPDYGKPYCPVDRVFTIQGQGTVVTGSLSGGTMSEGQTLVREPDGQEGTIRGIQQYHESVSAAYPGSRVALNIPEWDHDSVQRGDVCSVSDAGVVTDCIDGKLESTRTLEGSIDHDQEILAYLGTGRETVQILTEQQRSIQANEAGIVRLKWYESSVFTRPGDRIILRDFSDRRLLGAVTVLEVSPDQRLNDEGYRQWLRERYPMTPETLLRSDLNRHGVVLLDELATGTRYSRDDLRACSTSIDGVITGHDRWIIDEQWWYEKTKTLREQVEGYHREHPLEPGLPLGNARKHFPSDDLLDEALESEFDGQIIRDEDVLRKSSFRPNPNKEQETLIDNLLKDLRKKRLETPDRSELEKKYPTKLINYLIRQEKIVELSEERLLDRKIYEELLESIRNFLDDQGKARLSTLRDHLESSRKYVIPLMEYLDTEGVTVRDGDYRYLRESSEVETSTGASENDD